MISGAKAVVLMLEKEKVSVVFGLPGATVAPIFDKLRSSKIKPVLVRQEQSAGHCASGYARISNETGVCIVTSGPGALNTITAVATAYMDSIPMVIITGQVESRMIGRDVFQEADITGAIEPFVKHSYLVKDVKAIPQIMREAFYIAKTGRCGPVLIDIPIDVQLQKFNFDPFEDYEVNLRSYSPKLNCDFDVGTLIETLKKATKPLICVGGGAFFGKGHQKALELSKKANIPIVSTLMGLSAISPEYEKYLGMIGMYGAEQANNAMGDADLILLVGARVGDRAIMSPKGLSKMATIIHIDIDEAELNKNIKTDICIRGDAYEVLSIIIDNLGDFSYSSPTLKHQQPSITASNNPLTPQKVIDAIYENADDAAIIVADVGQNQLWAARGFNHKNARFLTSGGMGTMGYSLPAAIGASFADNKRQIIVICGDGGFQMSQMELATVVQNKLNIKLFLFNNQCLGLVKELQKNQYNNKNTMVDLGATPDYQILSKAYKIQSDIISSDSQIDGKVKKSLSFGSSFLCECIIAKDEPTM